MSNHFVPYGRQIVSDEDIAAVVDALKSDWLTTGPAVDGFQVAMANFVGAEHGVLADLEDHLDGGKWNRKVLMFADSGFGLGALAALMLRGAHRELVVDDERELADFEFVLVAYHGD